MFVGTFKREYTPYECVMFPSTLRLYADEPFLYLENGEDLFAEAELYEDDTFDFNVLVRKWSGWEELSCTCAYEEGGWYGAIFECECEGPFACDLLYTKM